MRGKPRVHRRHRRAGWPAACALLLGLVGVPAGSAREPAAPAAIGTRPNLIVLLTDDQAPESLPRTPRVMPYLEGRLADPADHWVTFSNAFLNTPQCCPSRATLLSGQWSHHTGVASNDLGLVFDESSTIATWLDDAGYRTGLFGRYLNFYPWDRGPYVPPGWDEWQVLMHTSAGATNYYGYTMNENGIPVTYGSEPSDYLTDVLRDKALAFIDETAPDSPFFLNVTFTAPHRSWTPAPRHATAFNTLAMPHFPNFNEEDVGDKPAWVRALPKESQKKLDNFRRGHYRTLLAVDEAVRAIVDRLRAIGQLENSVILYLSDNGYSFAEHRWRGKACVYEECIGTPFAVRFPGASRRVDARLVGNVDVAATLADLAGASPGIGQDGRSLRPLLEGANPVPWRTGYLLRVADRDPVTPFWGVRTARWTYAELDGTGEIELYDLRADPYQLTNLCPPPSFGCGQYESVRASLDARLEALKAHPPG